jgi:hypothetical protein
VEDLDQYLHERLAEPVEDRQFRLRGIVFTLRPSIRPHAMSLFHAIGSAPDDVAGAAALRAFMEAVLVDGEIEAWDQLCELDGDDALTIGDMTAAAGYGLRRVVGRPPTKPNSSGQTSETPPPTTASRDASSLRVAGSAT